MICQTGYVALGLQRVSYSELTGHWLPFLLCWQVAVQLLHMYQKFYPGPRQQKEIGLRAMLTHAGFPVGHKGRTAV